MHRPPGVTMSDPGGQAWRSLASPPGLLPLRFDRHEFAGSLGDIGIMIPLAVGVSAAAHLSLVSVFLCVAASYAVTSLAFRVPVPVQPMKAMGASPTWAYPWS